MGDGRSHRQHYWKSFVIKRFNGVPWRGEKVANPRDGEAQPLVGRGGSMLGLKARVEIGSNGKSAVSGSEDHTI
jgi:hypothetical protein